MKMFDNIIYAACEETKIFCVRRIVLVLLVGLIIILYYVGYMHKPYTKHTYTRAHDRLACALAH